LDQPNWTKSVNKNQRRKETMEQETKDKLTGLGVADDIIEKIGSNLGVIKVDDLIHLTEADLTRIGMLPIPARALIKALAPAVDATAELPEGQEPSKDQVTGFAGVLGTDPTALMLLMSGQGVDMDLSGMIPVANLVNGYNPKRRDLYLMVMGHVERRLGVPIIVIDGDGSVNRQLTIEYIEGLEEGRDAAENNIYFGATGEPHEVIRVGVDAQSVYDADPLVPTKALQKSGMGTGRVNWKDVSLEVKQVAYFAATKTGEIDPTNDAHQAWLRDHMKPNTNRLVFHGQAPRAIGEYNEAARTGSLPTLRVMLSRGPRRPEFMPRRRRTSPGNLTGIGDQSEI
jgi:hypothetical protein